MEKVGDSKASAKVRWGELEEEDNEDLDFLLPPPKVVGPDENGVKKIIEFRFNDQGQKVQKTTTTRIRKVAKARLSKRALERREWRKFGDAVNEDTGSRLTMVSTEEILLERPKAPGTKEDDPRSGGGDPLSAALAGAAKGGAVLMVCRICGKKGDHWTSKCPYKDLAPAAAEGLGLDKPPQAADSAAGSGAPGGKGAYVPPSLRAGATVDRTSDTSNMRRRNDENSVRVTNLSEDTREADLQELFKPFGHITRVYVAVDQRTGMSRGFGFVNFANREDAQRAINKLNGYGYDNLILRVEWATPRQT
uniref:Eukaryotic translation initiation factor 3 subunit G n=1 Tax=Picea sitchensis TaxID=3332 RepID=A9NNT0_PICSI|nr:unknown [Picea sitchensis]